VRADSAESTSEVPSRRAAPRLALGAPLEYAVVAAVGVAFALSFGLSFGMGNQATYLVPSLRALDPTLLARDWHETETTALHPAFRYFGAALLLLDRGGWGIALGFTLIAAGTVVCLYGLMRVCLGQRLALAGFSCVVALAFTSATRGPATTYVFDGSLQPSALSSAWFFAAAWCFVGGRFLAAGLLLGLSGLFHVNLLVLLGPAFFLAHALLGRAELVGRLARQLLPASLVVLGFVPLLASAAASGDESERARHIWHVIRFPHHFQVRHYLLEFGPLLAWLALGMGAALPLCRSGARPELRRLLALVGGLVTVTVVGLAAALIDQRAAQLLPWRVAAHAELLLQAAASVALVSVPADVNTAERYGRLAVASLLLGLAIAAATYQRVSHVAMLELVTLLAACALAGAVAHARPAGRIASLVGRVRERGPRWLTAGGLLLLVGFGAGPVSRYARHSTLLTSSRPEEHALYEWMRTKTPKDALFLTPPELEVVRLLGERAIVVDWKSPPGLPREVLEWYRRLEDITGRPGLSSEADLTGYASLDRERLARLRARYGFEFAVVRRGPAERLPGLVRVFENREFIVLRMPSS
jgi:hypothetical protein